LESAHACSFEEEPDGPVHLKPGPTAPILVLMAPSTPSAAQLAEYAGVNRSDEMDAVFRISIKEGTLRLVRTRLRPRQSTRCSRTASRSPDVPFDPSG
jgi:hypothetical protein